MITLVQETFKNVFDLPADFKTDGSQFDRLLDDGGTVNAGTLEFKVIFTPGHTLACTTFLPRMRCLRETPCSCRIWNWPM